MKRAILEVAASLAIMLVLCVFFSTCFIIRVQKNFFEEEVKFTANLVAINFIHKIFPELQKIIPDKTGFDHYYDDLYEELKKSESQQAVDFSSYDKFLEIGTTELWYWAACLQRRLNKDKYDNGFMDNSLKQTPYFRMHNVKRKLKEVEFLLGELDKLNGLNALIKAHNIRKRIHAVIMSMNQI